MTDITITGTTSADNITADQSVANTTAVNDAMANLIWLYGQPLSSGVIKQSPEDFVVSEELGYQPDGEGEHLLVRVRKTGCNTQFVAEQLAKFARIPARSVSYAGLKDRYAVTEQWFCLHLPGKNDPDLSQFKLDDCQIVTAARHLRKLRIGNLQGNSFQITLRAITDVESVESRLMLIAENGVINYFAAQRFGRNGNNLIQAERWANGAIRVKERQKRSFYLSAVRSAFFNQIASARISQYAINHILPGDAMQLTGSGSWFIAQPDELPDLQQRLLTGDIQITAPLPGDNALGTQSEALAFEQQQLLSHPNWMRLIGQEGLQSARRSMLVKPQHFHWQWLGSSTLTLSFSLPAGSFATSVIRELVNVDNQQFSDLSD